MLRLEFALGFIILPRLKSVLVRDLQFKLVTRHGMAQERAMVADPLDKDTKVLALTSGLHLVSNGSSSTIVRL